MEAALGDGNTVHRTTTAAEVWIYKNKPVAQSVWQGRSWPGSTQHDIHPSSYREASILMLLSLLLCTSHTERLLSVWAAG